MDLNNLVGEAESFLGGGTGDIKQKIETLAEQKGEAFAKQKALEFAQQHNIPVHDGMNLDEIKNKLHEMV